MKYNNLRVSFEAMATPETMETIEILTKRGYHCTVSPNSFFRLVEHPPVETTTKADPPVRKIKRRSRRRGRTVSGLTVEQAIRNRFSGKPAPDAETRGRSRQGNAQPGADPPQEQGRDRLRLRHGHARDSQWACDQ
jgi:hypothetical protein